MVDTAISRRSVLLGLGAALAAWELAGCGKDAASVPAVLKAPGVQRVAPPANAPVAEVAAGMAALSHKLSQVAALPGKNWIVSPLSLACAFAMARVGAKGQTASQLDQAFGFPGAGRDEAFNAITASLVTVDVPPKESKKKRKDGDPPRPPIVSIGNALFTQKGFTPVEAFLTTLAEQYGAGVRPVDFASDAALDQINAWADKQTAGRIKKVFDQLDPATLLVLANAIYFKADWAAPFEAVATGADTFTRADGSTVNAKTMHDAKNVRYASVGGIQAIELPYAAGPYAMWVILPPASTAPEEMLAPAKVAAVKAALTDQRVQISLPKWDFGTDIDLAATLNKLGLSVPFGPAADFSGIGPGMFIGQAIQKATITVDEWGTEAAAVTAVAMPGSAPLPPEITFVANRPFAFMVVGGAEAVPLFGGRVMDPTAS
jgi:serpin B